jgi:hypothetical protein
MSETGEEVQDKSPVFDNDLNFDADNVKHVFMAIIHLAHPQHCVHALDVWPKLLQGTQSQKDFMKLSPQHFTPMKMCSAKQLLTLSLNVKNGLTPLN